MAIRHVPGPSFTISAAANGDLLNLGNAGAENMAFGGFGIDFVTSEDFVGGISILGRSAILDASDANVPFMAWPSRPFYLNGATPSSFALDSTLVVTGRSYLVVPAPGISVGLLVACTAGTCAVYCQQMHGNTIP